MSLIQKTSRILLIALVPAFLTGCYTQFQTADRFPIEDDRYSDYYAWDGFEDSEEYAEQGTQTEKPYTYYEEEGEVAYQDEGYYYKDYETARWYKDNYADGMYWDGYEDGYDEGLEDGYDRFYYTAKHYNHPHFRYMFGYGSPYDYYDFYYYPDYFTSVWLGYQFYPHSGFYFGYRNYWDSYYAGYWGHVPYYYSHGWGYHNHYYGGIYAYNDYNRNYRGSRSAEIYRKGPRSNGIYTRSRGSSDDYRTRTYRSDSNSRTRSSSVTRTYRSRSDNSSRVGRSRSTGSSVGRSRSTGSSVGRSSSTGSRSRGSGSVGRSRGSSSSKGSSSGSRSRGRSGNDEGLSSASSRYIIGSGSSSVTRRNSSVRTESGKKYTIPPRRTVRTYTIPNRGVNLSERSRVKVPNRIQLFSPNRSRSSSIFGNRSSTQSRSKSVFSSGRSSSRNTGSSVRSSSRSSSSRSSSVSRSRSSGSSSKGRSSGSSSSKRKRGGNK